MHQENNRWALYVVVGIFEILLMIILN